MHTKTEEEVIDMLTGRNFWLAPWIFIPYIFKSKNQPPA